MQSEAERVAVPCPMCGGEGSFEAGGPMCCGGSNWECGGQGCTGPIDGRYLECCPTCEGSGLAVRDIIRSEGNG